MSLNTLQEKCIAIVGSTDGWLSCLTQHGNRQQVSEERSTVCHWSWLKCWMKTVHLRVLSLTVPRWKRAAAGRRPKDRSERRGSLVSPGLASQRDRFPTAKQGRLLHQRHSSSTPKCRGMGTLRDGKQARLLPPSGEGDSMASYPGQWRTVHKSGDSKTDQATQGAAKPHCLKGRDPRTPASWRHLLLWELSREPHARGAQMVDKVRPTPSSSVTVLWRCLQFLDTFDTPVTPDRCRVFFDKVVDDVPVVLCNGSASDDVPVVLCNGSASAVL